MSCGIPFEIPFEVALLRTLYWSAVLCPLPQALSGAIYTNVNPCMTCTTQGGAEKKMMLIIDEHESAFFERPFRTQATNAPRGNGRERHFSSMLWRHHESRTAKFNDARTPMKAQERLGVLLKKHGPSRINKAARLWVTHTRLKFSSRSPLPNENVGFVFLVLGCFLK